MNEPTQRLYTAFDGTRLLASGSLHAVALAVRDATEHGASGSLLIYDDASGRAIDINVRGTDQEIAARFSLSGEPRGRGRPKLGVVSREVTLLPRHWEWLGAQPGGASMALRKLVEAARHANHDSDEIRRRQEAAYHFMSAMAGDLPGFEEAARALFAGDRVRFCEHIRAWPDDIRLHCIKLGFADGAPESPVKSRSVI